MYVFVNWMKCTQCSNTNTLFYAHKETRTGRKTGILRVGGKCKLCYLEDKRIYENIYYIENREKLTKKGKEWDSKNREKRLKIYRDYHKRHKNKLIERRRISYLNKRGNLREGILV